MKKPSFLHVLLVAALPAVAALAQHQGAQAPQPAALAGPFEFSVRGAFKEMVQKRDFGPKATLSEALAAGATEGVGALSGLRGEVSIVGGRVVVSCGTKATCARAEQETAALLATARARTWAPGIALPRDMSEVELGTFIDSQAAARGLSLEEPFPLRVVGALADARMHVVSAPNPNFAGHGAGEAMAIQDEERVTQLSGGEVVGVRVPRALWGVATHPGEASHFHWVDSERSRTAHLDSFRATAGSQLLLPAP